MILSSPDGSLVSSRIGHNLRHLVRRGDSLDRFDEVRARGIQLPLTHWGLMFSLRSFFCRPNVESQITTLPELGRRWSWSPHSGCRLAIPPTRLDCCPVRCVAVCSNCFWGLHCWSRTIAIVGIAYTVLGGMWSVTLTDISGHSHSTGVDTLFHLDPWGRPKSLVIEYIWVNNSHSPTPSRRIH